MKFVLSGEGDHDVTAVRIGLHVPASRTGNASRPSASARLSSASVDSHLRRATNAAAARDIRLVSLFGPEHGFHGVADLIGVGDGTAGELRVHSLYGRNVESLRPTAEQLRAIDTIVIDLQDIGSRYYTFQATMLFCLEAAAKHKLAVLVLDRPNPLGGLHVEGPTVHAGFESFVGSHAIPTRHGLTIGELARLYHAELMLEVELEVIRCEGWRREMTFEQTGLPWVLPSPNIPTVDTAFVYPGQCLLEERTYPRVAERRGPSSYAARRGLTRTHSRADSIRGPARSTVPAHVVPADF